MNILHDSYTLFMNKYNHYSEVVISRNRLFFRVIFFLKLISFEKCFLLYSIQYLEQYSLLYLLYHLPYYFTEFFLLLFPLALLSHRFSELPYS